MGLIEQIRRAIEEGHPQETGELVNQALEQGIPAENVVEEAMMPAMKKMDEGFQEQECDIPRVLAAARSVRKGFEIIEHGANRPSEKKGTVILGTVEGDLHDVGKNLVALMFRSKGFEVIDLGVDISGKQFQKAIQEHPEVSIVCISSLLNTSIPDMMQIVKLLRRPPGRTYKIMVGGGAVTEELARQMGVDAYTRTAVDAVELAERMMDVQEGGSQ